MDRHDLDWTVKIGLQNQTTGRHTPHQKSEGFA
jgi:hypothetical protein